jgi:hypothetical protein
MMAAHVLGGQQFVRPIDEVRVISVLDVTESSFLEDEWGRFIK